MKKYYLLLALFLFSTFINGQLVGPKINSLEKEFDFGNIVEGAIVSHDFVIVNNGDAELYLTKVNSTCGCTVAKPNKEKLKPGESTKLKVTFNAESRSGKQKKYINVYNNDPQNTHYRLAIYANVVEKGELTNKKAENPKISLDYNQKNFGVVKEGTVLTWELGFKNVGNAPLEINDVQKSCGCTATMLSKDNLKPGEKGSVKVELDTKGMKGQKSRTIAITSNDPYNPRMVVTLFVDVKK